MNTTGHRTSHSTERGRVRPLAEDYATLYASPDPQRLFCYSPGIVRLPGRRQPDHFPHHPRLSPFGLLTQALHIRWRTRVRSDHGHTPFHSSCAATRAWQCSFFCQ